MAQFKVVGAVFALICIAEITGQANETYKACKSVISCFNDAASEMERCLGILVGEKPAGGPGEPSSRPQPLQPPPLDSDDCMSPVKDKLRQKKLLDRGRIQQFQGCLAQKIEAGADDVDPRKYRYCATVTGRYINKTAEANKRLKRAVKSAESKLSSQKPKLGAATSPLPPSARLSEALTSEAPSFKLGGSGQDSVASSSQAPILFDSSSLAAFSTDVTPSSDSSSTSLLHSSTSDETSPNSSGQSILYDTTLVPHAENSSKSLELNQSSSTESIFFESSSLAKSALVEKTSKSANSLPVLSKNVDESSGPAVILKSGNVVVEQSKSELESSGATESGQSDVSPSQSSPKPTSSRKPALSGEKQRKSGESKKASAEKSTAAPQLPGSSKAQKPGESNAAPPLAQESIEGAVGQASRLNEGSQQVPAAAKNRVEILREARRRLSEFKGCMARARIKREECKPLVRCCPDSATCYLNYETSDQHAKVHALEREIDAGRRDCLRKKRALNKDELTDALDQIDAEELVSDDSVVSQIIF